MYLERCLGKHRLFFLGFRNRMCVFLIITVIYKGELLSHDINLRNAKPAQLACLLTRSPETQHVANPCLPLFPPYYFPY